MNKGGAQRCDRLIARLGEMTNSVTMNAAKKTASAPNEMRFAVDDQGEVMTPTRSICRPS
jgi:hypothetical protein